MLLLLPVHFHKHTDDPVSSLQVEGKTHEETLSYLTLPMNVTQSIKK